MRRIKILVPALALAGFVSISLAGQQPAPSPSPATPQSAPAQPNEGASQAGQNSSTAAAVPVPSTAGAPEASNEQLRPVTGELEKKIDTKDAKAGDPVILKTTEMATTADGVVIPKGSRIVGHVTDVQAHSKTTPNARLTIQFDQAEIKGGQTLPIRAVMESVAPAPTNVHATDTLNSPGMGSTPMASPSLTGNTGSMAGSSGGAASAPSAGGGAPNMSAGTEQQATSATPNGGAVVARQGNVAIKTTAVPGVLLATNANGQPFSNAAGALLGAKQNVHLDGGTEIVLAVMETPQKPGTR